MNNIIFIICLKFRRLQKILENDNLMIQSEKNEITQSILKIFEKLLSRTD